MANNSDRWYFSKEKIKNAPSVLDGIEHAKELGYRQQCANLIQDIGQRLQVNQLVINTAIVYMHRFYMFHSFNVFHRNNMAACFLFLAAKVEEQPRKLEHILKASHVCLNKDDPPLDPQSDQYMQISTELVNNESILLQTLGFEVSVDHPNTFVVKCAQLVKAAQSTHGLPASEININKRSINLDECLHLTAFCIQYKPTLVACVCIYISCLWANYVIPETDGKNWYEFMDNTATKKQLEDLSSYFIKILDSCPTRLKKRLTSGGAVVYKDGKMTARKEKETEPKNSTTSTDKTNNNKQDSSSINTSKPSVAKTENGSKPIHTKTQLTGLLKPLSHESSPTPNRSGGTHINSHSKKTFENHKKNSIPSASHSQEHRKNASTSLESKLKEGSHHKTAEQLKIEQRKTEQLKIEQRKKWTPEQWEEYRKRKEKEKLYHQRKKLSLESNGKDKTINNIKSKSDAHFQAPARVRKSSSSSHSDSPVKRQKLDSEHTKKIFPEHGVNNSRKSNNENNSRKTSNEKTNLTLQHQKHKDRTKIKSLLSSSGSDSDSSLDVTRPMKLQDSSHQKSTSIKPLPPPPPPPPSYLKKSDVKLPEQKEVRIKHEYIASKLNAPHYGNNQRMSPPPPPPAIDPKYY